MKAKGGNGKLVLLFIVVLLLGLQSSIFILAPRGMDTAAGADDPVGWFVEYSAGGYSMDSVTAVNADICWASGSRSDPEGPPEFGVLKTVNGGAEWQLAYLGTDVQLQELSAVDANTCWARREYGILRTTDGGATWEELAPEEWYEGEYMYGINTISAVDANTCWISGRVESGGHGQGFIAHTIDGGENWDLIFASLPLSINDISAVSASTCWAALGANAGGPTDVAGSVLWTEDGGVTWSESGPIDREYRGVSAVDGQTAWVTALYYPGFYSPYQAECYRTTNGGATWEKTALVPGCDFSLDIAAIDAGDAWLLSRDGLTDHIVKTTNGGMSWSLQFSPGEGNTLAAISAVDSSTAWAAGALTPTVPELTGFILHTTDGGWPQAAPHINSLVPASGFLGDEITIYGTGLGATAGNSTVNFGVETAPIVSWSDTAIVCTVPEGLSSGYVGVFITTPGGTSNSLPFNLPPFTIIKGTVLSETTHEGLQGTVVSIYGLGQEMLASTVAGPGGVYEFVTDLPAGSYKVFFDDPSPVYLDEWYDNKADFASADQFPVTKGTVNVLDCEMAQNPYRVYSISPSQSMFVAYISPVSISGMGFKPGAVVSLRQGGQVIQGLFANVDSNTQITCSFLLFMANPGYYDVVVVNPDGTQAVLQSGFMVQNLPYPYPCGTGSGTTVLMLGISMGLLSLAGSGRLMRRRKKTA